MANDKFHPLLRRLAMSEVLVALVTLTFGALVTSKHAGMAFADWPTSDGYLMVTYPWLRDFAVNWEKFLEHGHRLAGMLIGLWSIALVVVCWRVESRRWVKTLALAILLGVICQGLLGGFRVQLNERGLAMTHGIFAAVVFSLMGIMCVVTGSNWRDPDSTRSEQPLGGVKATSWGVLAVLALQYILGSLIRHQGTGLHEHLGLGLAALCLIAANAFIAWRTENRWLRNSALLLLCTALAQVSLGLSTWVVKYGLPSLGYVAIADSVPQVALRTAHMVLGVITLMAAVVQVVKVLRTSANSPEAVSPQIEVRRMNTAALTNGGAP